MNIDWDEIGWTDLETSSFCDLPSKGAYNYSRDPTTQVLYMCWAIGNGPVHTWSPLSGEPFPAEFAAHIASGKQIRAHNSAFEMLMFMYVICPDFNVPEPKLEQWYCTSHQCRANGLPGSLEDVGRAIGSTMRKDFRGAELIRKLSIPQADGTFNRDPVLMQEFADYCKRDVETMREISQSLRQLSDDERIDFHINERINLLGIKADVALATAAIQYADAETQELTEIVIEVTEGVVASVRSPKMRNWVLARVGPEALELMTVWKDGVKKYSIDKSVRANLLVLADESPDEVPPDVAEVIQCADDIWASSVAKYKKLATLADPDDQRVRGAFMFNGAAATGRASSQGAQLHNMTKATAKNPDEVAAAMLAGEVLVPTHGKRVTDVLKKMLRPTLIPEKGNVFVVVDWSSIEARVLPWLSNEEEAEPLLDIYRNNGDMYIKTANGIFGINGYKAENGDLVGITGDQRKIGKVAVLACGYAGSIGAFHAMSKIYGIRVSDATANRIVQGWRASNPWAVTYWNKTERAYTIALRRRGEEIHVGREVYMHDGRHLWCMLPSGRVLCYPFCQREASSENGNSVKYLKAAWKPKADATEWPRAYLWNGLAVENKTQATANCILRGALRTLVNEGHKVVAHVHDECVIECKASEAEAVFARVSEVMCAPPAWATDLPLAVEGGIVERYMKPN